jgi:hypothetical protein
VSTPKFTDNDTNNSPAALSTSFTASMDPNANVVSSETSTEERGKVQYGASLTDLMNTGKVRLAHNEQVLVSPILSFAITDNTSPALSVSSEVCPALFVESTIAEPSPTQPSQIVPEILSAPK